MCSKCSQMQDSFMGRYGDIIKAYQNDNPENPKECQDNLNNNSEKEVCKEHQNNILHDTPKDK